MYPEYPFFWADKIQEVLNNVLFIWAKENPIPSYRQGMHEILAIIYLVLHRERKPSPSASMTTTTTTVVNHTQSEFNEKTSLNSINAEKNGEANLEDSGFSVIFDETFIENDCYTIFERLMSRMQDFYVVHEMIIPPSASSRKGVFGAAIGDTYRHPLLESPEDDEVCHQFLSVYLSLSNYFKFLATELCYVCSFFILAIP